MATERYQRLLLWMADHDITFAALGAQIGKSPGSARYVCINETIAPELHSDMLRLGFPEDLLPAPDKRRRGPRPRTPRFPGLSQAQAQI